ncbi:uncharacterized protein RCO7_07877 [Rhynchosporium graminicola]|uniref:CASTOR ACT domain-containing protein n=1 Tax=Rhynchosporium graminicola TaxID=2792576 RepID=A0A1E1KNC4_9HELO|nr:uncharacterized protein RCO7_07877 [Rhynchosporium commune]
MSFHICVKPILVPTTDLNTSQEGQFSLIHIPLHLYPLLVQAILQTLLPHSIAASPSGSTKTQSPPPTHHFLNISITPLECSIVCHVSFAQSIFPSLLSLLPPSQSSQCVISKDTYNVFSVNSSGMEAGQRVLDLTAPLAMAAIPIFFITTYYTDFILVPCKDRQTVGAALLDRGFEFSEDVSAYVVQTPSLGQNRNHNGNQTHSRGSSSIGSGLGNAREAGTPPGTPPPSNVAELQTRTFKQLRKRNVVPFIEPGLHLVQCSGKEILRDDDPYPSPTAYQDSSLDDYSTSPATSFSNSYTTPNGNGHSNHNGTGNENGHSSDLNGGNPPRTVPTLDTKFYLSLVSALLTSPPPRFLSLTLAQDDAPSLLIDKTQLWLFGTSIAGDIDSILIPIFLDLGGLPAESTGIVCGVAGAICEVGRNGGGGGGGGGGGEAREGEEAELSYLSTARAGAVILSQEGSVRALEALGPLLEMVDS